MRYNVNATVSSINPIYIQISKFFTGLTDRLTDKTDCLTPLHMRAWGNYAAVKDHCNCMSVMAIFILSPSVNNFTYEQCPYILVYVMSTHNTLLAKDCGHCTHV